MNTLFSLLFRPVSTFGELKTAAKFPVSSFVVLLILMLINQILMMPVTEKIIALTFASMSLPEKQLEMMTQVMSRTKYLQLAGTLVVYTITLFFYALLLFALIRAVKTKLAYRDALTLIVHCCFITVIGALANTAALYIRGLDAIENMHDISLLGLNAFTNVEQAGATLYTFLACFTPFQIAFLVLLAIGIKVFTEISYPKALTVALLLWLITILIPTVSAYVSEMTMAKSGMMQGVM